MSVRTLFRRLKRTLLVTPRALPAIAMYRRVRRAPLRAACVPGAVCESVKWLRSSEGKNALYDLQTAAVMARVLTKTSNCVDVGAADGTILTEMLRFAPDGHHYAFEPIPEKAERLRANFPTVRVVPAALSDAAGESTFHYVVSNPGYSGLRRRRYDRPDEHVEIITVRMAALDDILPRGLKVHFVKVDVEGAELQVFKGAVETIERHRPYIVFEHGLGAADCYGTTAEDVYAVLADRCGLRVSLMSGWLSGREALRRDEFIRQFTGRKNFYFLGHP